MSEPRIKFFHMLTLSHVLQYKKTTWHAMTGRRTDPAVVRPRHSGLSGLLCGSARCGFWDSRDQVLFEWH